MSKYLLVPLSSSTLRLCDLFGLHARSCPTCSGPGTAVCRDGVVLVDLVTDEIMRHDCLDAIHSIAKRAL